MGVVIVGIVVSSCSASLCLEFTGVITRWSPFVPHSPMKMEERQDGVFPQVSPPSQPSSVFGRKELTG